MPSLDHDSGRAVRAYLDVGRLQIAMDDLLLVRGFERVGDLARRCDGFVEWQRAARDAIGERGSRDIFENECARSFEPVYGGDVRVVQRREYLRLRAKRARRSESSANFSGRTLIATSRPSRVSRARYTSPMPPAPINDVIS
jgi:hypothetical protein